MFLLAHYIAYYHILVMQTVAETGILTAPTSKMRERRVTLHPFTCTRLHSLYKFCNGHSRWQRYKDMHMVRHSSYAVGLTREVLCDAIDIGIQLPLMVSRNSGFTTIGAKNNVIIRGCITHACLTQTSNIYCIVVVVYLRHTCYLYSYPTLRLRLSVGLIG